MTELEGSCILRESIRSALTNIDPLTHVVGHSSAKRPKIPHFSSSDLVTRLTQAMEWFESQGVGLSRSRFGTYRNLLAKEAQDYIGRNTTSRELRELFAAASEATDCVEIAALREVIAGHPEKLRRYRNGAPFYDMVASDAQDQGRDVAFEMIIGASLHKAGAHVTFDSPSDVVAVQEQEQFLIECKRPKTTSGLANQLKRASEQFENHRAAGNFSTGIVAIDLTRILNPSLEVEIVDDPDAAIIDLHARVRHYLFDNVSAIQRHRSSFDPGALIHGMLVRCAVVYVTGRGKHVESTTALQIYPQGAPYSDAYWRTLSFFHLYERAGALRLVE